MAVVEAAFCKRKRKSARSTEVNANVIYPQRYLALVYGEGACAIFAADISYIVVGELLRLSYSEVIGARIAALHITVRNGERFACGEEVGNAVAALKALGRNLILAVFGSGFAVGRRAGDGHGEACLGNFNGEVIFAARILVMVRRGYLVIDIVGARVL